MNDEKSWQKKIFVHNTSRDQRAKHHEHNKTLLEGTDSGIKENPRQCVSVYLKKSLKVIESNIPKPK